MKRFLIPALAGLLALTSLPAAAQTLVLPSAPRNAAEQRLNDRIEMQTRANAARGITNSRDLQRRDIRRDRDRRHLSPREARRLERQRDHRRMDRRERRGEWDGYNW
ncbi:hypothetical protein [Aureimonas pseudogalii]|uniref:Uncharacterized protein n=1 Tax=Aureimonas pseudogalii TaxID=1744844 RepID=A0A7W6H1V9_9HYPH|nr:hypothetical protein [Aureimonas pseudogalii]MBB3996346.1 hypothetical protein [Aureimonas pseudogalii]